MAVEVEFTQGFLERVRLKLSPGTSLVVQGLRPHGPSVGGLGLIPGQGSLDPIGCNSRSHLTQLRWATAY